MRWLRVKVGRDVADAVSLFQRYPCVCHLFSCEDRRCWTHVAYSCKKEERDISGKVRGISEVRESIRGGKREVMGKR
jgi:hypothetical protein